MNSLPMESGRVNAATACRPSPPPAARFHWRIESLLARGASVFGHGFLFHEQCGIVTLSVRFEFDHDRDQVSIPAETGKSTTAIGGEYSGFPAAGSAGFVLLGDCGRAAVGITGIALTGLLSNGECFDFAIPPGLLHSMEPDPPPANFRRSLARAGHLFERAWRMVWTANFTQIYQLARRRHTRRTIRFSDDAGAILQRLRPAERDHLVLIIDHELGGGANQFRDGRVANAVASGATVLIFTFQAHTLRYRLQVCNHRLDWTCVVPGPALLLDLARSAPLRDIIYNNAVSFPAPEQVPLWLIGLKRIGASRLTLLLHDFYALCSSPFLLDDTGTFCNVPDLKRCQKCQAVTRQDFTAQYPARDIDAWRAHWGAAIAAADCVSMASTTSLDLLLRAYPDIDKSRIEITPHPMQHISFSPMRPSQTAVMRIGTVGHIGYHKGARILHALAEEIKSRRLPIKIVVIGVLDGRHDPDIITCTGRYQPADLPALIRQTGINTFLLPSIYPETFSYVIHELIALELPVACFNLGAPAQRLRQYAKGLVLASSKPAALLDGLIGFHRLTYPASA